MRPSKQADRYSRECYALARAVEADQPHDAALLRGVAHKVYMLAGAHEVYEALVEQLILACQDLLYDDWPGSDPREGIRRAVANLTAAHNSQSVVVASK